MLFGLERFSELVGGLDHPECVAWGPDGHFYAGGEAGQIYRIGVDGSKTVLANTGGFLLGVCLDGRDNVYACDVGNHAVLRITPLGEVAAYSMGTAEAPMNAPNGLVFDRHGNLWVTDSGERGRRNGRLFHVAPGGVTERIDIDLVDNPNGLAIDPQSRYLYAVLTDTCQVMRAALPEDPGGALGAPEEIVRFAAGNRAIPDGLAFDVAGSLYIGCMAPNVIYRLTAEDVLDVLAEDWEHNILATPVNVAFGGEDMRTLAVANFARWGLVQARMDVPGARLNYPFIT